MEYNGCQAAHLCDQYQKEYLIKSLKILVGVQLNYNNEVNFTAKKNSGEEIILHLMSRSRSTQPSRRWCLRPIEDYKK